MADQLTVRDVVFQVKPGNAGGGAYGGSDSCSMKWVTGFHGKYNTKTYKYDSFDLQQNFSGFTSGVLGLTTETQENMYNLPEGLKKTGFIKLGGFKSAHGTYLCNLWFLEPRAGKDDSYNKGKDYHFYPNVELYPGGPGCDGKAVTFDDKELKKLHETVAKHLEQIEVLTSKLASAEEKITELKAQLAEQRSLRKSLRPSRNLFGVQQGNAKAILQSRSGKTNKVRMGKRIPRD